MFSPSTHVPGASRATVEQPGTKVPVPAFDKRGRPAWNMPEPARRVPHFKSEGCRREFVRGRHDVAVGLTIGVYDDEAATEVMRGLARRTLVAVPVYSGTTAAAARYDRAQRRRAERLGRRRRRTRRKKGGAVL